MTFKHLVLSDKAETATSLSQIERASALIQNSKTLDELFVLKAVFNEAEIRARKKGLVEVEQKAIEYKFWVIDKEGALLEQMKANGERESEHPSGIRGSGKSTTKTLKDLGISKTESSRVQQYHKLPEDQKQEIIEKAKRRVEKVKSNTIDEVIKENLPVEETPIPKEVSVKIYNCDFFDLDLKDESIDFILTDPPWTRGYDKEWNNLGIKAAKCLKQGSRILTYFGHETLLDYALILKEHLHYLHPFAIILVANRNTMQDYFCEFRPAYIFEKLPHRKKEYCTDLFDNDVPEKRYHTWGQGVSAAEQIIRFHSKPNDLLFEPFAGGGSFIEAAINQKRNVIACEIDKDQYGILKQRFPEACQD